MVFFSGTDWSELEDNAPNHNLYLSLIVNNFMDFCAKVCFIVESSDKKKFDFIAKDENGEKYIYDSQDYVIEDKKLVVYDCDIVSPTNDISVNDSFKRKVETIIEEADRRVVKTTNYNRETHRVTPIYNSWGEEETWGTRDTMPQQKREEDFKNNWDARNYSTPSIEEDEDEILEEAIESFTIFLLTTGSDISEFNNITDVIENYKGYNLSGRALAKEVLDKYVPLYKKFFNELPDKNEPDTFMYIIEQVIENLEDERDCSTLKYIDSMLNPIIDGLRSMLKKFKK